MGDGTTIIRRPAGSKKTKSYDDGNSIRINGNILPKSDNNLQKMKNYFKTVTREKAFFAVLEENKIELTDEYVCGGNSIVYFCKDNTVLKVTSEHINGVPRDRLGKDNNDSDGIVVCVFDEDEKLQLKDMFRIEVRNLSDERVDYLHCYHLPLYDELSSGFIKKDTDTVDENEILKLSCDILEFFEHHRDLRHRDIKPDNIMYNKRNRRYVLIDWGEGGTTLPIGTGENTAFARKGYTDYYVDPERIKPEDEKKYDDNDFRIDLYSLGVVMAYLAHPKGWRSGKTIEELAESFGDKSIRIIKDIKNNNVHIVSSDIAEQLTDSSPEYKEIVRKAMEHKYERISDMLEDVKKLRKEPDKNIKGNRVCKLNPFWGIIVAGFLFAVTFALSGNEGMEPTMFEGGQVSVSIMLLIMCGLMPLAFAIFDVLKENKGPQSEWYAHMKYGELIGTSVMFLIMGAVGYVLLKELNMDITLDVVCVMFLFSVLIAMVTSRIAPKRRVSWIRLLVCGGLAGLCVGLCVASCISIGDFADVFSPEFVRLITLLIAFGAVLGTIVYLWNMLVQSFSIRS